MNTPSLAQCDPSDRLAQREVEIAMLQRLAEEHPDWLAVDWVTTAEDLALPLVWQKAKPDVIWKVVGEASHRDEIIICECYARIGQLNAGHRRKLAMDAFKLVPSSIICLVNRLSESVGYSRYLRNFTRNCRAPDGSLKHFEC